MVRNRFSFIRLDWPAVIFFLVFSTQGYALPIGFGINQGDLEYQEIQSKNFISYHDARVPREGAMIINSLESIKPLVDKWLGVKRSGRLPVISSAATANPSFANFMTDVIELQTLGHADRDLYWHEYSHTMMYEHFSNFLGPAGSLIHLPWIPAWFMEGFAEALSVSVGSDVQASIERFQALVGNWPTYDSMHSLYNNNSLRRYSTSGAFVSWIFRRAARKGGFNLREFIKKLSSYTDPKYYFWSMNPFSDFMPMDEVLRDFVGSDAKTLYQQFQQESKNYWTKRKKGNFFGFSKGRTLNVAPKFVGTGGNPSLIFSENGLRKKMNLEFDAKTGWLKKTRPTGFILPKSRSQLHISRPGLHIAIAERIQAKTGFRKSRMVLMHHKGSRYRAVIKKTILNLKDTIFGLYEAPRKIVWFEKSGEIERMCFFDKKWLSEKYPLSRSKISCPVQVRSPISLLNLGSRLRTFPALAISPKTTNNLALNTEIWFAVKEETLVGNRYKIIAWDSASGATRVIKYNGGGNPLQMASSGKDIWLLISEHNRRSLRKIDAQGSCKGVFHLEDLPLSIYGKSDGRIVLGLYQLGRYGVKQLEPAQLQVKPCAVAQKPTSPLIWAMGKNSLVSFKRALVGSTTWKETAPQREIKNKERALLLARNLSQQASSLSQDSVTDKKNEPASWRPRPVFAFPWISGDDARGMQVGFVTIPLMDHMQNETILANFFVGLNSQYPHTDINMQTTRFWPTISARFYRHQVWNGSCRRPDGLIGASYFDEKGVKAEIAFPWVFSSSSFSLSLGVKGAKLDPYMGSCLARIGRVTDPKETIVEPSLGISFRKFFGRNAFSLNMKGRAVPALGDNLLNYHVFSASARLSIPLWSSRFSLGIEGSATRGQTTLNIREAYQPLKTFVPGSGGGVNNTSQPITDPEGRLFKSIYGDSKARFSANWTYPIFPFLDKQIWLFYMQSLNFTAFYNHGGAWDLGKQAADSLIEAHGYKIDLLFENKGVGFNVSLGSGQVPGEDFEVYMVFGFDALFEGV